MVQKGHNRVAQIHEEIEGLKRQRTQFEIQLKGLLKSHLEMLDMSDPREGKGRRVGVQGQVSEKS